MPGDARSDVHFSRDRLSFALRLRPIRELALTNMDALHDISGPIQTDDGTSAAKKIAASSVGAWLRESWLTVVLAGGVILLLSFSMQLAATRIYQVDECMEVYVARVLSAGQDTAAAGHVTAFQIVLSWLLPRAARAADLFAAARVDMLLLFWVNWILLACATGERLLSRRWIAALAGAATLAPMWDYGFEVRHDNLLLTGLLLLWCALRFHPTGVRTCIFAGAMTVALEFVAFKAFVYTVPLSLAVIVFPHGSAAPRRWKLGLAWVAAALIAFTIISACLVTSGLWDLYAIGFRSLSQSSTSSQRFWPNIIFSRLFSESPLLLPLVCSAFVAMAIELRRRRKAALTWDGNLPEALLVVIVLAALLINPRPYPYNVLHFAPFAFLFAFRHAAELLGIIRQRVQLVAAVAALVVFAHFIPFWTATRRHVEMTNTRQESLMRLAEDITDPTKDPVFDGTAMVPTRPVIDSHSFLHGLYVTALIQGSGPQIRDMLAAHPAAVLIPNYRTDWLPEPDQAYIREHYVALSDDFNVLGTQLPAGGGTFEVVHAGRYRIARKESSDLAGTYRADMQGFLESARAAQPEPQLSATLDGKPLTARPVELSIGTHRIECAPGTSPAVLWVGPRLDRLPRMGAGDHRRLFVNWY